MSIPTIRNSIAAIFEVEPKARLTTEDLAARIYGHDRRPWHRVNISRSLAQGGAENLGLKSTRAKKPRARRWHHVWEKSNAI